VESWAGSHGKLEIVTKGIDSAAACVEVRNVRFEAIKDLKWRFPLESFFRCLVKKISS
jgi:hypothetical protein